MGNEAIALGAIRAGVRVAAGYPGIPSTEILENIAKEAALPSGGGSGVYVEWSVNDKTAVEVAAGAALSGERVLVTMNQAGLSIASASLLNLNFLGVSGALVIAVADDLFPLFPRTGQDSRSFASYAKFAALDPSGPVDAY